MFLLAIFGLLALVTRPEGPALFDELVLSAFHRGRSETLTQAARMITALGNGEVVAVVTTTMTLLLIVRGARREGIYIGASVAGAGILNQLLKVFFARPRPSIVPAVDALQSYAFPSGHSMGTIALLVAAYLLVRTGWPERSRVTGVACAGLAFAIGTTRVYLGVHYPTDVLGGWAMGAAWAIALHLALFARLTPTEGPDSLPTPKGDLS